MDKRTMCKGCGMRCGLVIEFADGKPTKVKGDKEAMSQGFICPRPKALVFERTNHPQRVLYPLKKVGQRWGGEWQRISWDQALDEIAARLGEIKDTYGAEAIAVHASNGFACSPVTRRFSNLLGTPNQMEDGLVCFMNVRKIEEATFGWPAMFSDSENARCVVVWGGNPANSHIHEYHTVKEGRKRGAKLIVVDPRLTETARIADIWLQIRPTSDGALFLCWLNIIIQEELYDKDFVAKWTNAPYLVRSDTKKLLRESDINAGGDPERFMAWDVAAARPVAFDREALSYRSPDVRTALTGAYTATLASREKVECKTVWQLLKERVADYTAEKVSEITWVPADKIRDAARMYATNRPASLVFGMALDGIGRNSCQAIRARAILRTITGNVDVKGGSVIPGPYPGKRFDSQIEENDKLSPEQKRKLLGADKFRLISWESYEDLWQYQQKAGYPNPFPSAYTCYAHKPAVWRAMLTGQPYPVKAFLVVGANPLVMSTNATLAFEAMSKLDLLVASDIYMTPTTELADYVLPATPMGIESPELNSVFDVANFVAGANGALEPPGECWTDWQFLRELGVRMGQHWPWKTVEEMYDWQLEPMGYTWKEFVEKVRWVAPPKEFKKYEKAGFGTPSGKVEIYSSHFEKVGYDPLPSYEEPPQSPVSTPELAREYPYILGSARPPLFRNASYQELASIRKTRPDPLVIINPETAASLGVSEGDWVWIESPLGKRIKQKAKLFDGVHPRVVFPDIGRWYPEGPAPEHGVWESNVNVIINDDPEKFCDPIIGSWPFNGLLCKISKV
ncbi:MAG TPA: molybdopterin-dependent oxidoreductase [Dehalococcoidia bacterium]|nr:molybdopterin-dependent oxidoreductase [Dehalococcoidia bacterium]